MGLWDDLSNLYQGATKPLNAEIKSGLGVLREYVYEPYQEWAKKNRDLLPNGINSFIDNVNKISEVPGSDYIMPGMAPVGLVWNKTKPILQRLNPQIASKDLEVLERLSNEFPQIKKVELQVDPMADFSSWFMPLKEDVSTNSKMWSKNLDTGTIRLGQQPNIAIAPELPISPELAYAHEASHTLSGPLGYWVPQHYKALGLMDTAQPARAAMEGFAEGFSHGILNKFNKEARSGYWYPLYKRDNPAGEAFKSAGWLGRAFGEPFRKGAIIKPNEPTTELINLVNDIMKRRM